MVNNQYCECTNGDPNIFTNWCTICNGIVSRSHKPIDKRPANCRNRLRDEGKSYPKSGCNHCGQFIKHGCKFDQDGNPKIEEDATMPSLILNIDPDGVSDPIEWPELPVWPDFIPPMQYENPAENWQDPRLPDFRLIWRVARSCGYAIGLHGSMKRDVDLIAVAWVDDASTRQKLIDVLCEALNAKQVGEHEQKPNRRTAVTLQIDGWYKLIDLSIVR